MRIIRIKYNYSKPVIDLTKSVDNKSYFKAEAIRHPIIEIVQDDIPYIPNDIFIGIDQQDGVIIFGENGIGKSSTMKAIGLNIILAQAGMYVPCAKLTYAPYHSIFTRIPEGDNLFKGQSTFTCELIELRNILKKSDKNSLIIGDELCSGSDSTSAIAIIGASIIQLVNRKSSFVFSSHIHELKDLDEIKKITNLKVYYMTATYDNINDTLVFNRKLKLGHGERCYGLQIAKAFDLEADFMKNAEKIKKKLLNEKQEILEYKKSRYNSKILVNSCSICGKNNLVSSMEVHHIRFQCEADDDNNIDKQFHKNTTHNLVTLCSKCHSDVHNKTINLNGYISTTNGLKLDYTITDEKLNNVKKNYVVS